jgi:5-methylcytosine-specific restriction endonuclease McrA
MGEKENTGYEAYLQTELWETIRSRILKRDHNLCVRCGDWATQVHHRNYKRRTMCGGDDKALVSLCAICHRNISVKPSGQKRRRSQQERLLKLKPWNHKEIAAATKEKPQPLTKTERWRRALEGPPELQLAAWYKIYGR